MITYDEGYFSGENTLTRFLPDDTVFLIGLRPAATDESGGAAETGTPGRWTSTPAIGLSFDDVLPGPFVTIDDRTKVSPKQVIVEGGINGLPTIQRPLHVRRLKITAP